MSRIRETIQEHVVEPKLAERFSTVIGQVEYYDHKNSRGNVRIPNMQSVSSGYEKERTHVLLRNVPIAFEWGIYAAGPFVGDKVWVGFQNNDIKQPYIIGHADPKFSFSTRRDRSEHGSKGGFKADANFVDKDNFRAPHAPEWFHRSRYPEDWSRLLNHYGKTLTSDKFLTETRQDKDVWTGNHPYKPKQLDLLNRAILAPVETTLQAGNDDAFKHHAEVKFVHPFHTSGLKIKDNAEVDIFVHPHHGIRIDPDTRTINTNSEWFKHHVDEWRAWVTGQTQWRVDGKYVCEVKGTHETHSDGLFEMHSRKDDIDIESEKENVYITAAKEVVIKAGTNIKMMAGSWIMEKAPRIDLN